MKELKNKDYILELIEDLHIQPINGFRSDTGKPRTARFVILKCYCGEKFRTQASPGKKVKSCKLCSSRTAGIKHSSSGTPLHNLWISIRRRCRTNEYYVNIEVCQEWDTDYVAFEAWALANGYSEGLEIDRRDNLGNYEPGNCRFTTRNVQGRNTRRLFAHNTSGYRGVTYDKSRSKWKAYLKVNNKRIQLGRFHTALEAAKAYDTYVTTNNLEHTLNGVLE